MQVHENWSRSSFPDKEEVLALVKKRDGRGDQTEGASQVDISPGKELGRGARLKQEIENRNSSGGGMEIRGLLALGTGPRLQSAAVLRKDWRLKKASVCRALVRSTKKAGRLTKLPLGKVEGDLLDPQSLKRAVAACDLVSTRRPLSVKPGRRKKFYSDQCPRYG